MQWKSWRGLGGKRKCKGFLVRVLGDVMLDMDWRFGGLGIDLGRDGYIGVRIGHSHLGMRSHLLWCYAVPCGSYFIELL